MLESIHRRWMLGGLLVWLSGCHASLTGQSANSDARRFRGIGLVLVTDAVPGAEMLGVEFFEEGLQRPFYAKSRLVQRNREIMAYPGGRVPEHVRVVWHDSTEIIRRRDNPNVKTYAGQIIGDHTIPVASRIPDEVLREIRARGGALRLKFRLKPDGVLFGWDIERPGGGISKFEMPGGDFLDTRY